MAWRVITRYNPNRSGMASIAKGRHLKAACHDVASKAEQFALLISPSGFNGYAEKFEIIDEIVADIPARQRGEPMERVASTLINQSDLAVLVEVGSQRSEEYRVLTTTLKWIDSQAKVTP